MRIPRIFHPAPITLDTEFELSAEATHHVANVLRLRPGHPVVLFNGDGNEYSGVLVNVSKRQVVVEADACLSLSKESPLYLHLGQGISKGDRMETVLQKAVELGVAEITPLITERCSVKLDEKRWEKKTQQWLKIISGACEQCGRNKLPKLNPPTALGHWLAISTKAQRITLAPTANDPITKLAYHSHGYQLLIGPEGGLSDNEIHQAQECGYLTVSMGPRVLRTETAAITSLSILQAMHGDF
ncbi:16S rRNA (uracil(1498)-N(3))-methyltransferase [Alteromonas ponticola]|uniref:Ribosomal RNA small subunit methyltransferase E n=1 Tax=Alteromonas aquimaris TaxID=2998417 RepID=A0ABT3P2Q6_9ALTE|nr:16S rRNA (uracil(1498)-N(3))-methyltransferase [Alteromonas aquimaris]MCW8107027.1 16S rRNA (uracil(1498)-N(3))-methyltransferase [Alteromonas aquimaris]